MSKYETCVACSEENKMGSDRCARCGAVLNKPEGTVNDPELTDFYKAEAEMKEKNEKERLERFERDAGDIG
jgi:uncharacterized Zn finger protein (UPF0148 family)